MIVTTRPSPPTEVLNTEVLRPDRTLYSYVVARSARDECIVCLDSFRRWHQKRSVGGRDTRLALVNDEYHIWG